VTAHRDSVWVRDGVTHDNVAVWVWERVVVAESDVFTLSVFVERSGDGVRVMEVLSDMDCGDDRVRDRGLGVTGAGVGANVVLFGAGVGANVVLFGAGVGANVGAGVGAGVDVLVQLG